MECIDAECFLSLDVFGPREAKVIHCWSYFKINVFNWFKVVLGGYLLAGVGTDCEDALVGVSELLLSIFSFFFLPKAVGVFSFYIYSIFSGGRV